MTFSYGRRRNKPRDSSRRLNLTPGQESVEDCRAPIKISSFTNPSRSEGRSKRKCSDKHSAGFSHLNLFAPPLSRHGPHNRVLAISFNEVVARTNQASHSHDRSNSLFWSRGVPTDCHGLISNHVMKKCYGDANSGHVVNDSLDPKVKIEQVYHHEMEGKGNVAWNFQYCARIPSASFEILEYVGHGSLLLVTPSIVGISSQA